MAGRISFATANDVHAWGHWWNPENLREPATSEQTSQGAPTLRVEVTPGITAIGTAKMKGLRPGDVVTVRLAYFGQGAATICPCVQDMKYSEPWVRVQELDLDTSTTPGRQAYQWTVPAIPVHGAGFQIENHGLSDVVLYRGQITW